MYPLIRCYCGRELGYLYMIYKRMLAKKKQSLYGTDMIEPHMRLVAAKDMTMGKELTDLGIKESHMCCRTHMLTQVEFKDL
jgi:DNA-directed RNA polymerase subunit N (RpoN/RPB10)